MSNADNNSLSAEGIEWSADQKCVGVQPCPDLIMVRVRAKDDVYWWNVCYRANSIDWSNVAEYRLPKYEERSLSGIS